MSMKFNQVHLNDLERFGLHHIDYFRSSATIIINGHRYRTVIFMEVCLARSLLLVSFDHVSPKFDLFQDKRAATQRTLLNHRGS
jgi:hypothetical protein